MAERFFSGIDLTFFGLTKLMTVPLRTESFYPSPFRTAGRVNRAQFGVNPLKWQALFVLMKLEKRVWSFKRCEGAFFWRQVSYSGEILLF